MGESWPQELSYNRHNVRLLMIQERGPQRVRDCAGRAVLARLREVRPDRPPRREQEREDGGEDHNLAPVEQPCPWQRPVVDIRKVCIGQRRRPVQELHEDQGADDAGQSADGKERAHVRALRMVAHDLGQQGNARASHHATKEGAEQVGSHESPSRQCSKPIHVHQIRCDVHEQGHTDDELLAAEHLCAQPESHDQAHQQAHQPTSRHQHVHVCL
mmetsp:Transcript_17732/g.49125  ORF Transcript_17732/g.49125 Transcript_17732/m.49125 type:complete len:215 (+) Transcript_17732:192-836(+)